jgi:conjugal transfer pilus assembly protein TraD
VRKQQNIKPQANTPDRAHALVLYYQDKVIESERNDVIDGLINMYQHSREHFQKMITSLIPTLNMLTSGDLKSLLSPSYLDFEEKREILDSARVLSRSKILFLGLDSLSDGTIGSAIGSIILSDLTSVAADIYNHEPEGKRKRLSIFIDEAAEVVNKPTIQLLNKSRSANFFITLLSQTLPDFVARTGNEAMARQILGNCGNLIALRSTDSDTQEYCVESFGKTAVKQQMHTQSTNPIQNKDLSDWSGGTGERLVETEYDLFSGTLLSRLPDLHYISTFDGGNIFKGAIPLLTIDKNWRFEDHWPPKRTSLN